MISVCLASFNGEAYIQSQLASILKQLASIDEVIVSDDGSKDRTIEIVQGMKDDRIKVLLQQGKPLGVQKNFERALFAAVGDIIFLADQDDIWLENKVSKCVEALEDADLVVSNCSVVDAELNVLIPSFFRHRNSGPGVVKNIIRNSYLGCCMAFKKEILNIVLPIPQNVAMHDIWIGLLANLVGKTAFIPIPLVYYRRHRNNLSPTAEKSTFSFKEQFKYRLILSYFLLKRVLLKA